MQTGMIDTSTSTTTATKKTASQSLDKNSFLTLLVAQLKNQDPTSASSQDPNQMIQQMTSFSSLEQMQNMNTALTGIQSQNNGIFQTQAASLVGKQVQVTSTTFNLKDGKSTIGIYLPSDANVSVQVKDASGKVITTLDQGAMTAGNRVVSWNGKDSSGNTVADGTYSVNLVAKDNSGKDVAASATASVKVDSVSFVNGAVMVVAGGRTFSLSDVTQISA